MIIFVGCLLVACLVVAFWDDHRAAKKKAAEREKMLKERMEKAERAAESNRRSEEKRKREWEAGAYDRETDKIVKEVKNKLTTKFINGELPLLDLLRLSEIAEGDVKRWREKERMSTR